MNHHTKAETNVKRHGNPFALDTTQTVSLSVRLIATILLVGSLALLGPVAIPFAFALVIAVTLSPLVEWLESVRVPRFLACGLVMAGLVCLISVMAVLLVSQVGSMLRNLDQYLGRLNTLMDQALQATGLHHLVNRQGAASEDAPQRWAATVQNVITMGVGWAANSLGGLAGLLTGGIVAFALAFYMLLGRDAWMSRISFVMRNLGMRPRDRELESIRSDLARYWWVLSMLCLAYAMLMTLLLTIIGLPNAIVWGLLTGLLEVVPFFGPVLAAILPTLAALGSGGPVWQPFAVVGIFLGLQLIESNLVGPWLFGRSVSFDPVVIILAILFFGFIWGPAGLPLAVPVLIVFRGLISITPHTPNLDALVDSETPDPQSKPGETHRTV